MPLAEFMTLSILSTTILVPSEGTQSGGNSAELIQPTMLLFLTLSPTGLWVKLARFQVDRQGASTCRLVRKKPSGPTINPLPEVEPTIGVLFPSLGSVDSTGLSLPLSSTNIGRNSVFATCGQAPRSL